MVKFSDMSKFDQHEMKVICYDSISCAKTKKDLEAAGKLVKDLEPDEETRAILKIAYLKRLKELKNGFNN